MKRLLLIPAIVAALAGCTSQPSVAAEALSHPHMVVHKTDPYAAPENTLPGIDAAKADGGDTVEMDVRFSKSGYPVMMHDATLDRTTDCIGPVVDQWASTIKECNAADYSPWETDPAYDSVTVPYAWDAFKRAVADNLSIVLHVKAAPPDGTAWGYISHYIDYFNWGSRTVIMTDPDILKVLHSYSPDLSYVAIEWPSNVSNGEAIRTGEYLKGLGASGYAFQWKGITSADVAYWHSYGLKVYTWTTDVNSEDVSTNWAKVNGVDYLITNHPETYLSWAN